MIIIPTPLVEPASTLIPFIDKPFVFDATYTDIGPYTLSTGSVITFYLHNQNNLILGVVNNIVVFVLALQPFKYSHSPKIRLLNGTILQVFKTYVSVDYRRLGITTHAYEALVSSGKYYLVCSPYQTIPMLNVWKKIATDSAATDFEIGIIDKDVIRVDSDNKNIAYDGANIPDADLWSTLPNRTKEDVFMVIRKKLV